MFTDLISKAAEYGHNETQIKPHSSNNEEDWFILWRPKAVNVYVRLCMCVCAYLYLYMYMCQVYDCVADVENYGSGTTKWTRDKAEVQNL